MLLKLRNISGLFILSLALISCSPKTAVLLNSLSTQTNIPLRPSLVSAGYWHTCVVLNNGVLKCFGNNASGVLGAGNTTTLGDGPGEMGAQLPAVNLGSGLYPVQMTGGWDFQCAILSDSSTKCWGENWIGNLGYGDTDHRGDNANEMGDSLPALNFGTGKTAVKITSGYYSACALLNDATIKCWGRASSGQAGTGTAAPIGDNAGEMGNALQAVDLGTGKTAKDVESGGDHVCAILNDDSVKCWGNASSGQLGTGNTNDIGDGPGEMGDALAAVDLGTGKTALKLAAGREHTCALLNDSSVKCWGYNSNGQLGLGHQNYLGNNGGEMGDALPAINFGTGRTVKQIVAKADHSCALLDNNTVKCWGANFSGEGGQGNTSSIGELPGQMGDALTAINLGTGRTALQITAGDSHVCALLDNYDVKCWGYNGEGALGYGHMDYLGDGPGEMGDALPAVELF